MATTDNLGVVEVATNQTAKEVTLNNALNKLDNATQGRLAVNFTANARTLSATEFTNAVMFVCAGLTGAAVLTVPLTKRLFVVDTASQPYGVTVKGPTGSGVFLSGGSRAQLYCDGTNVLLVSSGSGAGGGSGGVSSFNTRSGEITLQGSDVTGALGYVPISAAVSTVVAGTGLAGGTITASGTLSLAQIAPISILMNPGTANAAPTPIALSSNFSVAGGTLQLAGLGTGTMTNLVVGGGLDGGTITASGTIGIHGADTATLGQMLTADGAGGVAFMTSIPASDTAHLLGGTGTIGMAGPIALGSNLTLASGTLSLSGTLTGMTLAGLTTNTGTITGGLVTGLPTPTSGSDAATKAYVDATLQGASPKPSAKAATTAPLATNVYSNGASGVGATLTAAAAGALTLDGVTVVAGDVVLVKDEADATHNGLYLVTQTGDVSSPYVLTRHPSMDVTGEVAGALVAVEQFGATNANSLWLGTPATAVTIGTTAITFTQVNAPGGAVPGTGISINSGTISLAGIGPAHLLGNPGTGSAAPASVAIGTGLSLSAGGTLAATGLQALSIQQGGAGIGTVGILNLGSGVSGVVAGGTLTIAAPGGGTMMEVDTGSGLEGGPISVSGTVSLAPVAGGHLLANPGTASAAPADTAFTTLLDGVYGTTRGQLIYRTAGGWGTLPPGTAGQVLRTGGAAGDPSWIDAVTLLWNAGSVSAVGHGLALNGGTLSADNQGTINATATGTIDPTGLRSCLVNIGSVAATLSIAAGFAGQNLRLEIKQGTTAQTVGFDSTVIFGGDVTSYTVTPTANKRDLVQLIYDGAHWMFAAVNHGF